MVMKNDSQDRSITEQLMTCFPERSELIQKIYPQNRNFREVAEDYFFCKYKISSLSGRSEEDLKLIVQYESTMKDLEEELLQYLKIK